MIIILRLRNKFDLVNEKGVGNLEWIGFFAFMIIICYSSYPSKIKKMESKLKKLERNMKGENSMSKILSELINKKCKLVSDDGVAIASNREFECTILDIDDEWIKFTFKDKKGIDRTKILRIESIERVDLIDD